MKSGKHRPCPPATTPILEVLALLALLEWRCWSGARRGRSRCDATCRSIGVVAFLTPGEEWRNLDA